HGLYNDERWILGMQPATLRHIRERTRSVLGGFPMQSMGTIIIVFLQEDLCITMSAEHGHDQCA
ncbi:hypothetical protein, partial [Pseudomonas viridiflava]|uniref:hypothetical protein n=1 Tax=Pseudomonas viridiflava TaxID=33069 RepID=UPI00197FD5AC